MAEPPPLDQWLDRLQAAQPANHALRLTNVEAQLTTLQVALAASVQMAHNQETFMAATDDKISELTANLQNIEGDVQRLNELTPQLQTEVARLQDELAAQDPALAAKLQPLVDLSQQIADATPEPTPAPAPAPAPTPTPEPTPTPTPTPEPTPTPTPTPTPARGGGTDVINPTVNPDQPA
jgi:outer membrane biosynthesis protein TonB